MDIAEVVKHRLETQGLKQQELAKAAQVTESYISQLLTKKKAPPAPAKTDIYGKMERLLKLPDGELVRLAELQRNELLRTRLGPSTPMYKGVRELVLRKCHPEKVNHVRQYFERHPFGELERLITRKLLDVVKDVAAQKLSSETWLRSMAQISGRSYEQMRTVILDFLDADICDLSNESCISFLDPLLDYWDIDMETFTLDITLNRRIVPESSRRFEFVETNPVESDESQTGIAEFLNNTSLSGDATEEEIEFLKRLKFRGRRPNAFYYYRELQNLRDPIHFGEVRGL